MYSAHGLTSQAIKEGKQATLKEWLEKEETKVNEFRGGSASHSHFSVARGTALHWAAYYGQLEIAQLLIDKGAGKYYCSLVCPKCKEPPPYDIMHDQYEALIFEFQIGTLRYRDYATMITVTH